MSSCQQCNKPFNIPASAARILTSHTLPQPNYCHLCSWQRKMAWQNEYKVYKRKCDATSRSIISAYREDVPFPVYDKDFWFSDECEVPQLDYDMDKSFFEQYWILHNIAPRPHVNQVSTVNSEYANFIFNSKDCYLSFQAFECEKLLYCYRSLKLRDSVNCFCCSDSELLYECASCHKCYNTQFSSDSENCIDSSYLFDCKGCTKCSLCWNLRNQEYCFLNKKLSKADYKKAVAELKNKPEELARHRNQFLLKSTHQINTEDCSGDYLINCSKCRDCYFTDDSQDCTFVMRGNFANDCLDTVVGGKIELCYNVLQPGWQYHSALNAWCYHSNNVYLSEYLDSSNDCIGCIGLKHGKYRVLNKQYSEKEYQVLKAHIFDELRRTNSFDEFFRADKSPFHYEETIANLYFPDPDLPSLKKPAAAAESTDDSTCRSCGKVFNLTKQELDFYTKAAVRTPDECFYCRISRLAAPYSVTQLYQNSCSKCEKDVQTKYTDEQGQILCPDCYLKEVF